MRSHLLLIVGMALVAAALAGCDRSEAEAVKTAPLPAEDIVKRIQNDPHMPPDQKAAAIARVQSHPVPDKPTH